MNKQVIKDDVAQMTSARMLTISARAQKPVVAAVILLQLGEANLVAVNQVRAICRDSETCFAGASCQDFWGSIDVSSPRAPCLSDPSFSGRHSCGVLIELW